MSQDFDELMRFFRRRGELLASGLSFVRGTVAERQAFRETFDAFLAQSEARRTKFFQVCKRTHWTQVTRESLLATFASVRAVAGRRADADILFHWLQLDLLMKFYVNDVRVPGAPVRMLPSIEHFTMLPEACADGSILCRAITPPITACGAHFIAEDPVGNAFWVHLASFPYHSPGWAALKVREGMIVEIRSPAFNLTQFGWEPMIRCIFDHNFVPIHDLSSPTLQKLTPWFVAPCATALEWKQRGNEYFKRQDFDAATAAYTRGIELESNNVDLLSNRANSLTQRGKWQAALDDADRVLAIDANHLKCAKFRATALTKQRRYRDAASAWMRAAVLNRDSPDAKAECTANATKAMVAQRQTEGVFDWPALVTEIFANHFVRVATYQHPAIHMKPTTIAGRKFGMFAREAIPRGTLLVVDTPMLQTVAEVNNSCDDWLLDAEKDESIKATLTDLYDSAELPNGCMRAFDMRVRSLCSSHSTMFVSEWYALEQPSPVVLGLFVTLARFNHSCLPNCVSTVIGSVAVIQTAVDVPAGSELFVAHCQLQQMLDERKRTLFVREFVCQCARCHSEVSDPILVKIGKKVRAISGGKPLPNQAHLSALIDEVLANPLAKRSYGALLGDLLFPHISHFPDVARLSPLKDNLDDPTMRQRLLLSACGWVGQHNDDEALRFLRIIVPPELASELLAVMKRDFLMFYRSLRTF